MRDIINNFDKKKVMVVGDIMLDKYLEGSVDRISPEAPIPIVEIQDEKYVPDGAANVASNVASLEGKVLLIGKVGKDSEKKILSDELRKRNVDLDFIVTNERTIQKIRVVSQNQQLVRIDYETKKSLSQKDSNLLIQKVKDNINDIDVVILSDYAKGILTKSISQSIIELSHKYGRKVLVDPKPQNIDFYYKADLITPNKKEAYLISNLNNGEIEKVGKKLYELYNSNVLITRGSEGMSLFELNGSITHIPTKAKEVFDVSGAGDTVIAALALSIASGADLKQSAIIANHAAGIVVGKHGTSSVSYNELVEDLENETKKSNIS